MSVIPLNHEPTYVKHHKPTLNLSESIKSSIRNNLRSSETAALACATAMSATSWTFSAGSVRSTSRMSLENQKIIFIKFINYYCNKIKYKNFYNNFFLCYFEFINNKVTDCCDSYFCAQNC